MLIRNYRTQPAGDYRDRSDVVEALTLGIEDFRTSRRHEAKPSRRAYIVLAEDETCVMI